MRASLAQQIKFSIFQYNSGFYIYLNAGFTSSTGQVFNCSIQFSFLYIFKCGLHWLDRLSFQLFNIIQFLYIFKCGLHWLDRLSFQLFKTIQFFIYIEMQASLARQVKFSIVQYNSVFYIFKCGLHWLERLSFQLFNTIQFFIYI